MSNRPRVGVEGSLLPGVLALALFGVLAVIVLNTSFGEMTGFGDAAVTSNIGYALLGLTALQTIDAEPFLVSFLLIAVVLDAALDASLVLAKREEGGRPTTALFSLGPSRTRREDASSGAGTGAPTDGGVSSADDATTVSTDERDGIGSDTRSNGGERA